MTSQNIQKPIFWQKSEIFKIIKNRIFWSKIEVSPVFSTTACTCIESVVCGCAVLWFENHKIQVGGQFGSAGRNARGHWGEIWGGLEICRCEICNYGLVVWIWHARACHTARAADTRIPPGPKIIKNMSFLRVSDLGTILDIFVRAIPDWMH